MALARRFSWQGGISDAENWQAQVVRLLQRVDATILNPRRTHFPANNLAESRRQIEWEARHLQKADLVAFWFPPQSLCPIALFELGIYTVTKVQIVVGTDPHYARRFDLDVQLSLRSPELLIVDSLTNLAAQIIESLDRKGVAA
jgi:hypothetical protein